MSELLHDRLTVAASPEAIWAILEDVDALGRVLPGVERIEARGPGAFDATLSARIQFLTVRADVEATLDALEPPRRARLRITGRPRGLVGSFTADVPFELLPVADGASASPRTEVDYRVELSLGGRLAAFGAPLLRDTFRRQVATLVANLETELRRRED